MREKVINEFIFTIKCVLSCILAIVLANELVPKDALSAAFVASMCVKPTLYTGFMASEEQFSASLIGGGITAILVLLFGHNLYVAFASIFTVVSICVLNPRLNLYFIVAVFTCLYILIFPIENAAESLFIRMGAVFLGIASASVINFLVSLIKYESFFYYRVRHVSSSLSKAFKKTIVGNKTADIKTLDKIYSEFEMIYSELITITSELESASKEIKLRKKVGSIDQEEIQNMQRMVQTMKTIVRYLQDIAFVSKSLAPNHNLLPKKWKEKIDSFWDNEEKRFDFTIEKITSDELKTTFDKMNLDIYDNEFIQEITDEIKQASDENKMIYTEFLSLVTNFKQLNSNITMYDYFVNKYLDKKIGKENKFDKSFSEI